MIELVVWLVLRHPTFGVPLLIAFAVLLVVGARGQNRARTQQVIRRGGTGLAPAAKAKLRAADPTFSEILFLDQVRLIFARAQEERGRGNLASIAALLDDRILKGLRERTRGPVEEVVVGVARMTSIEIHDPWVSIEVLFEANFQENGCHTHTVERWSFRRTLACRSPGPERMRSLGCPACGSTLETRPDGSCVHCDTPIGGGQQLWQVTRAGVSHHREVPRVELSLGGGMEIGTDLALVRAADLDAQIRALSGRHPELRLGDFNTYATAVFLKIQEAWAAMDYEKARPYETDALYQQHRYWLHRYRAQGLRNRLEDIRITRIDVARLGVDAWVEFITLRMHAQMRDWTEDGRGQVVGGSKDTPKRFTEYWTFVRGAGGNAKPRSQVDQCPSCGAALDNVGQTGICGYCDAKVTSGDFDWVLAAIDQDEVYQG